MSRPDITVRYPPTTRVMWSEEEDGHWVVTVTVDEKKDSHRIGAAFVSGCVFTFIMLGAAVCFLKFLSLV